MTETLGSIETTCVPTTAAKRSRQSDVQRLFFWKKHMKPWTQPGHLKGSIGEEPLRPCSQASCKGNYQAGHAPDRNTVQNRAACHKEDQRENEVEGEVQASSKVKKPKGLPPTMCTSSLYEIVEGSLD